jgi:hypothetical protein
MGRSCSTAFHALPAGSSVVDDEPTTDHLLGNPWSDRDGHADELVAGGQWIAGSEFASVQMKIRTADTRNEYSEKYLSRPRLWDSNLAYRELSRLVVHHGLHRVH